MTNIAFIGVGNMGNPMAANLIKAGHAIAAFDLSADLLAKAAAAGATAAASDDEILNRNSFVCWYNKGSRCRECMNFIVSHCGDCISTRSRF